MKIRYLDGYRFKRAIIAGSVLINNMQKHLNNINVFPIPDGDTGTNMASTMNYIINSITQSSHRSIETVSSTMAESALMGAQGNSGAILAQFFNGFAEAAKGKIRLSTTAFAEAIRKAKDAAFEAINDPQEGTILTVIKDWVNHVEQLCQKTSDFVELFKSSLQTAKKSLAETPQKLKILAKAGVVDAGAQGFVHLLEGIAYFIEKGKLLTNFKSNITDTIVPQKIRSLIKFQYCTECILITDCVARAQLQKQLTNLGDSLIIANKDNNYRIHIHTNHPQHVFELLEQLGTIKNKKIDDMYQQIQQKARIAVITDSSCDLPADFLKENVVYFVPTKIAFGPETYRDKIDITPNEFYDKLVHSDYHPTTSQPSLASFKEVYDDVVQNHESAISIHLPSVASGTFERAEHAAKLFGKYKITCIDGKNVSVALGLVVMEAIEAVKRGNNLEQVIEKVKTASSHNYLFASISDLNYMVRGGRISRPKWFLAKLLHLKPIVSFDKMGHAKVIGKAIGEKALIRKTLNIVKEKVKSYREVKFMVAHAHAYQKAEWYVEKLKTIYNLQEIPIVEAAPVLGVHAGPGTAAIAFLGHL